MHRSTPLSGAGQTQPATRIGDRDFAPRQKILLEGLLKLCTDELVGRLDQMLTDLERHLFQQADQARSNDEQRSLLEAQRRVHEHRDELVPAFVSRLETSLACLADPPPPKETGNRQLRMSELSLVETSDMDETVALKEVGTRGEVRNSLALFLLGQRMGVVARKPAFESEQLPVGPHRLCQILRESIQGFDLSSDQRALLYAQFDHSVMQFITPLYEALNNYLIEQGILPHLAYVAPRNRAAQREREAAANAGRGATGFAGRPTAGAARAGFSQPPPAAPSAPGHFPPPGATTAVGSMPAGQQTASGPQIGSDGHPVIPWGGTPHPSADTGREAELFDTLRKLLAGRRSLLDRLKPGGQPATIVSPQQVQHGLDVIQQHYNQQIANGSVPAFSQIRQNLMAQLAKALPEGETPSLPEDQGDTLDLVGLLFDQITQEVPQHSPGANLLAQLQLPLLRVALQDHGFFTDRMHPARRMLDVIAETSLYWSSEEEVDRELIGKMHSLLQKVNQNSSDDPALFRDMISDLTGHLATQQRKAEVSERRHVEAARGREKLEIARLQAEEAIIAVLAGKAVPKFLQTLLEQVWSDVLALSLLRGGEESDAFQHQLGIARKLVASARSDAGKTVWNDLEREQLRKDIHTALAQVGYTGNDAKDICDRLLSLTSGKNAETTADPASRTELALKLRKRSRLGQDVETAADGHARPADTEAPLTAEQQARYEQLKRLPYGTWFEFTINQQGDRARRRMSWFSTVTDHCVFVNHRGQRAGDHTLTWLAREMCRGNVSLVHADQGSVVDRAWKAIAGALRSFSGRDKTMAGTTPV